MLPWYATPPRRGRPSRSARVARHVRCEGRLARGPPAATARAAGCQRSLWAVAVYRFGRWVDEQPPGARRRALSLGYWAAFLVAETLTGVSILKDVQLGSGLRIHHAGPVVVNAGVSSSAQNCTMEHGVTLGVRHRAGRSRAWATTS